MKQKEYHKLKITVFTLRSSDIVRTSDGGGTGLESYDVWDSDQAWQNY